MRSNPGQESMILYYKNCWIEHKYNEIVNGVEYLYFTPCTPAAPNQAKLPKIIKLSRDEVSKMIDQSFKDLGFVVEDVKDEYIENIFESCPGITEDDNRHAEKIISSIENNLCE